MDSIFSVPGALITSDGGYLRGHGTQQVENLETGDRSLISSVAGTIQRVNKLISVKPVKARYIGEVGDLVVGRISGVESKRWKVDILGWKHATLQLSSVTLPGGVQRMRTYEDQLQMRTLYREDDLISAEIQNISQDGSVSLHTRSLKYGKLENGQFLTVPSELVKRVKHHYLYLPCGLDVILGKNGGVWITRSIPDEWREQGGQEGDCSPASAAAAAAAGAIAGLSAGAGTGTGTGSGGSSSGTSDRMDEVTPVAETLQRLRQRHATTPLLPVDRETIGKTRNSISLLAQHGVVISSESINHVLERAVSNGWGACDILHPLNALQLLTGLK